MAGWFWSFYLSDPDKLGEVIRKSGNGIVLVKTKRIKASYECTVFIAHDSEAHHNILRNKKLRYHKDYHVVLLHQVSINEMNQFEFYRLFPKTFTWSKIDSNFTRGQCRDKHDVPHSVIPTGIPLFRPPKSKVDVCYVDRLIISRKALHVFLNEKISGFDYNPVATSASEKNNFENMPSKEQKNAEADWWELIPMESNTISVYEGASEICRRCSGWLGQTPNHIISIPKSSFSRKRIPNPHRPYYPLEHFEKLDIQSIKWIKCKHKKHEIIHKGMPIVSRRFFEVCRNNNLRGYYTPGKKGLEDDLFPIEHEEQSIFWM